MRSSDQGFILYSVLGVTALLAAMFVGISLAARGSAESAALAGIELADEALLQAGLEMAGYQLLVLDRPWQSVDGQEIRLDNGTVTLDVAVESGKVDLNGGDAAALEAAYAASSLSGLTPVDFAARISDWRDPDGDLRPGGAELADYDAAGMPLALGNRAFRSIDELGDVLGVGPSAVDALRPWMTVYNPDGRLTAAAVSPQLAFRLPGFDEAKLDLLARAALVAQPEQAEALRSELAEAAQWFSFNAPTVFRVVIAARLTGAAREVRAEAVIVPGVADKRPYQVVFWR